MLPRVVEPGLVVPIHPILRLDRGASSARDQSPQSRDLLDLLGVVPQELVLDVTHIDNDAVTTANLPRSTTA